MELHVAHWLVSLTRVHKTLLLLLADMACTVLALWLAFSLRWGVLYTPKQHEWWLFVVAPLIAGSVLMALGVYRSIIRYIEFGMLWLITQAVFIDTLAFAFVIYQSNLPGIPRTITPLNGLLLLLLISSSRLFLRWWLGEQSLPIVNGDMLAKCKRRNVIIYGAGSAGVQLLAALSHGREYNPVAFIDDDMSLHYQQINGIKIYSAQALSRLIKKFKVTDVLLAMPSAKRSRRSEIIETLESYAVHVMSMPSLPDIAQGKITFDKLQEVDIADLLGRDCVAPIPELLQARITGKVVMVTGAGGSIGSELCRQILPLQPDTLILFERSEFALYSINKELSQSLLELSFDKTIQLIPILGSVVNVARMTKICRTFAVQTIYHAAAYKHVPMVEHNPIEAIWNNVIGTLHLAEAALSAQVETFVLISTDKAVRPKSVMGATKRLAELILQAFSTDVRKSGKTRFVIVRFGNVLGSSGSVVPLFREQIAQGGPVTVTDERVIRYFMTVTEAAQLVLQAGALGLGGDVFVLDMGQPVPILELAKRMIHLSGLAVKDDEHPNGEIEIVFTGLRSGEKLFEELLLGDAVSATIHPRILRAEEQIIPLVELEQILTILRQAAEQDDCERVQHVLQQTVMGLDLSAPIKDRAVNFN